MIQESKIIELFDSELFSTNILIDIASQASLIGRKWRMI